MLTTLEYLTTQLETLAAQKKEARELRDKLFPVGQFVRLDVEGKPSKYGTVRLSNSNPHFLNVVEAATNYNGSWLTTHCTPIKPATKPSPGKQYRRKGSNEVWTCIQTWPYSVKLAFGDHEQECRVEWLAEHYEEVMLKQEHRDYAVDVLLSLGCTQFNVNIL